MPRVTELAAAADVGDRICRALLEPGEEVGIQLVHGEHAGKRYLVSMLRERLPGVRNLRTAGVAP